MFGNKPPNKGRTEEPVEANESPNEASTNSDVNQIEDPSKRAFLSWMASGIIALTGVNALADRAKNPFEDDGRHRYREDLSGRNEGSTRGDIEKALNMNRSPELMPEQEVQRMQNCQEIIYRHYIDPSFVRFLTGRPWEEEARETLLKAIGNPYELYYEEKDRNIIEIKKRKPGLGGDVPDDLSIKIEMHSYGTDGKLSKTGRILSINDKNCVDSPSDPSPWMSREQYEKNIPIYEKQFESALTSRPRPNITDEYNRNIPEYLKKIFELHNIIIPQRIVELLDARGVRESGRVYDIFRKEQNANATTYEEVAEDDMNWTVTFYTEPDYPGIYLVYFQDESIPSQYKIICFTPEGYMIEETDEGEPIKDRLEGRKWAINRAMYYGVDDDEQSEHFLKNEYYNDNPRARGVQER